MGDDNEKWMGEAIALARQAAGEGEVPIGCVIVYNPESRIIGRGYNRREVDADPSAHAEIVAMREAGRAMGYWRLVDCSLYVTLEPCPMCAGAIVNARIPRLVYGCADPKAGAVRTLYQICEDARLNHRVEVTAGVLAEECGGMLREFFRVRRKTINRRGAEDAENLSEEKREPQRKKGGRGKGSGVRKRTAKARRREDRREEEKNLF